MQFRFLGDGNRYEVQGAIGRDIAFEMYRAWDGVLNREVAIRVLRDTYSRDPKFVRRFQQVAGIMLSLQHPNIVQAYDYGQNIVQAYDYDQTDDIYFIVMELIEGTDLRRYLRSRGMLDTKRAIIIAHDVALGVGAMHRQGIVHRAVTPQNVTIGRDGTVKLSSLSLASFSLYDKPQDTEGMVFGSFYYFAPEQAHGELVNPAADVYALGTMMYDMLAGRTPFDGDTPVEIAMHHIQDPPVPPSQYNPAIPPVLEEIILRCLEKAPGMRYCDGSQLARALESLNHLPV